MTVRVGAWGIQRRGGGAPWGWPLDQVPILPSGQGCFGAVRRHDVHAGVDLYAPVGAAVRAVEAGEVVAVDPEFTGGPDSPWWERTSAVLVEGGSGVVLYGEVDPAARPGDRLGRGDLVGTVLQVLRPRPGKAWGNPPSMLHLELYEAGARAGLWWPAGQGRPQGLLDPTPRLREALPGAPGDLVLAVVGVLRDERGRVLLLRRHPGDREASGLCFPGGKVEPGESLAEALVREFLEETGIRVGFGLYEGVYRAGRFEIHVLWVQGDPGSLRADFPTAEHAEALWLEPGEAAGEAAGEVTRGVLGRMAGATRR